MTTVSRTQGIVQTLLVCLGVSTVAAGLKIFYGSSTHSLSFIADGIHSLFDSTSTVIGIITVILARRPPDESHPYGREKFETLAAILLSLLLFAAAYEVATLAYYRISDPHSFPNYDFWGLGILVVIMFINLGIAKFESKRAKELKSPFLASDAIHNQSDFLITCAVLMSVLSVHFQVPYVDAIVAIVIALYLVYLSIHLIRQNINPLVDRSVLESLQVEKIVLGVPGVRHCHAVRSRGLPNHHFLDLNIHLSGKISLNEAHKITHLVEHRLKEEFPGLVDVVIHTEPEGHPPCTKDG